MIIASSSFAESEPDQFMSALTSPSQNGIVVVNWENPSDAVDLENTTVEEFPLNLEGISVETQYVEPPLGLCPECPPYSTCPTPSLCEREHCYRGEDTLGGIIGKPDCVADAIDSGVYAYHSAMDFMARCERAIDNQCGQCWVSNSPLACAMQCKFVNWRHNSMYLQGCMPEGYDLWHFAETVNHVDFHGTPLHENGPVETGATQEEIDTVDGLDAKPLSAISLDITPPKGSLPDDGAEQKFTSIEPRTHTPGTHRPWNGTTYHWNASLLNHQPLYFEDVNLARHGFSNGFWQPAISGAKFFATLPALPYLMTANPPSTTRYTLGETRPGNHACYIHQSPPLDLDAAAVEGAVITGLFFIIP